MSRRRGEFEHRTSIFEGAFRAWSHLGGLEPEDLENKPSSDLDPLTNPIENDPRFSSQKKNNSSDRQEPVLNPDGSKRREYPYEPLPRTGLAHPYVQAILSPWLGPDADSDAIQLGLTTLRTWWQHRRKGESGSAIAALGTEKMKGVVEGYTRHFFTLAHCLVVNDKEQPPRTLHTKMKELEKQRNKRSKKRGRDDDGKLTGLGVLSAAGSFRNTAGTLAAGVEADLTNSTLTPLERLHAAQQRQLAESGGIRTDVPSNMNSMPVIDMKGKCVPGKIDLPSVVDQVGHQASRLAHQGGINSQPSATPSQVPSSAVSTQYGDPDTTPVVFCSENGDKQIAMTVDGITCAHCVKIVETVLRGCNGNKSPIDGLLDAAADRVLCSVLIKIDKNSNAKRISFEAARNLAMVGYTAKAKEMSVVNESDNSKKMDLRALDAAFDAVASSSEIKEVFNWSTPCTCPDNGVLRDDCSRHSQMSQGVFEAFDGRKRQVLDYVSAGGVQFNSGVDACPAAVKAEEPKQQHLEQHNHQFQQQQMQRQMQQQQIQQQPHLQQRHHFQDQSYTPLRPTAQSMQAHGMGGMDQQGMGQAGMGHSAMGQAGMGQQPVMQDFFPTNLGIGPGGASGGEGEMQMRSSVTRNPSILSYGNGLRHMSITSETTFGRAMSGLSALSIDWENMDDFDINEDHSLHINNLNNQNSGTGGSNPGGGSPAGRFVSTDGYMDHQNSGHAGAAGVGNAGYRRSSFRRSFVAPGDQESHVSFKV